MPDSCPRCADAAALRLAFARAAERWSVASGCRPFTDAERRVWAGLYEVVRDHTAGLALLAELERLRAGTAAMATNGEG